MKEQLAGGPRLVAELPEALSVTPRKAVQTALITVAVGEARFFRDEEEIRSARAAAAGFNAMAVQRLRNGVPLPGMVSPKLGEALRLTTREQTSLFSPAEADAQTHEGLERAEIEIADQLR